MANKKNDTRYKFVNFDQIYLRKSKLQIGIVNMNIVIRHGLAYICRRPRSPICGRILKEKDKDAVCRQQTQYEVD